MQRRRSVSRPRSRLERSRSRDRRQPSDRMKALSRRSQSLSPQRIGSSDVGKDLRSKIRKKRGEQVMEKTEDVGSKDGMDMNTLEKMREDFRAKLAAMEDAEEGEIADSEDEEITGILSRSEEQVREEIPGILSRSEERMQEFHKVLDKEEKREDEGDNDENGADGDDEMKEKSGNSSSDKENGRERKRRKKGKRRCDKLGRLRESSCSISADDLQDVSTEDLDNKLIPFKKRQFKELEVEAKLIQVKWALQKVTNDFRQ